MCTEGKNAHLIMNRSKELAKQQDIGGEADYARGGSNEERRRSRQAVPAARRGRRYSPDGEEVGQELGIDREVAMGGHSATAQRDA